MKTSLQFYIYITRL